MQGSIRRRGTTWSYRIDFGKIDGKRRQIEKGGYKKRLTRHLQMLYRRQAKGKSCL